MVRSDAEWKDQVKEISGGGVDVVLDPVGGDRFTDSLRSLREDGRLIVVGFTGGSIPEVKVNRLLLNNTSVVGAGWGAYVMSKPELSAEIQAELDGMIDSGAVKPIVGARFPLADAAEAMNLIDSRGALGKVVSRSASERRLSPPLVGLARRGDRLARDRVRRAPVRRRVGQDDRPARRLMFLASGVQHLMVAMLAASGAWLLAIFGVLFLVAGVIVLANPEDTFAGLADVLGPCSSSSACAG